MNYKGGRVILLSGGPPISLKVLYCLHRLGLKTHLVDLGGVSAAKFSRYLSEYDRLEPACGDGDGERLATVLKNINATHEVLAVVPSDVASAAALHDAKPFMDGIPVFPVSSPETLKMLDDKWRFQQFLEENDIPVPRSMLISEPEDIGKLALKGIAFPAVVKSLYGESGHGVFVSKTREDVERYLQSGSRHARLPVLLQEFVPGLDADLSILCEGGEVRAQILQIRRDGYILEFAHNDFATDIGRRIAKAANFSGVANIDLRLDEITGEATVIECNPRFWYTLQASMWRGLNFLDLGMKLARGEAVPATAAPEDGLYYLHGGLVRKVLWNPVRWNRLAAYNLRGLMQALTDPMPFIRSP
jgi:biotin carboxylase